MKSIIHWNVTPSNLGVYQCFGGSYCFHIQGQSVGYAFCLLLVAWLLGLLCDPEDGDSMILRNVRELIHSVTLHNIRHSYRYENLIYNWIYEALHIAVKSNKCAALLDRHFRQCFPTRCMFRSLLLSCFPFTFSGEIGWQCRPRFDTRWDTISLPLHKQWRHPPSYRVFVKMIKNVIRKYFIHRPWTS